MKFRGFSKNLSDEVENLFANLGGEPSAEQTHRLDDEVCIADMLERIKNLDTTAVDEPKKIP